MLLSEKSPTNSVIKVYVLLRGTPSQEDLTKEQIEAASSTRPNMRYEGPYKSPRDLPQIYGNIDFAWSIDYTDAGKNSDWLLPNRIYEGALFGALALARRGTATGNKVEADGLGWALDEPLEIQRSLSCRASPATTMPRRADGCSNSLPRCSSTSRIRPIC